MASKNTANTVGFSYHQQIHHGELSKNNKGIFEIPSSFQMVTVCFFSCANGAAIFILYATVQCIVPTCSFSMDICYLWTSTN